MQTRIPDRLPFRLHYGTRTPDEATPANAERREMAERRYDAALCDVDRLERVACGPLVVA